MDIATRPVRTPGFPRAIGILALIGILIAAGVAAAYIGSRSQVPARPFGLAANGQIAFSGNGDIRTVDQVSGQVSDLIVGPEVVGKPSYSLDGRRIAFVRDAGGPNDHVVVATSDGSRATVVTPEGVGRVMAVRFAPSGEQVVIEALRGGVPSLAIAAVDGSDFRWLPIDVAASRATFLPPSGATLLFVSGTPVSGGEAIERLDVTTGRRTVVVPSVAYGEFIGAPTVSPDGDRFAFARWVSDGPEGVDADTYTAPSDGSSTPTLLPRPPATEIWAQGYPAWSNDGSRLAFLRSYEDRTVVAIVPADLGGSAKEIPIPPTTDVSLSWSPDDRYVLGVVYRDVDKVALEHFLIDVGTSLSIETAWDHSGPATYQRVAP